MRNREKGRSLPDIDVLARAFLRRGLSEHPDAAKHVTNPDDIENMSVWELLNLAKTMGVDPAAMIRSLEQEDDKRWEYTHRHPGFEGVLEFDLVFELAGKRVTRKAKVVYTHTPEWEYFDVHKQAPNTGLGQFKLANRTARGSPRAGRGWELGRPGALLDEAGGADPRRHHPHGGLGRAARRGR